MKTGISVALLGSALLGSLAVALVGLFVHSAPVRAPAASGFSEFWEADAAALAAKSNRLPLKVAPEPAPWPAPQLASVPVPPPDTPPRELTQITPEIVATRKVPDLCERHGLHKVWINSRHWRCR